MDASDRLLRSSLRRGVQRRVKVHCERPRQDGRSLPDGGVEQLVHVVGDGVDAREAGEGVAARVRAKQENRSDWQRKDERRDRPERGQRTHLIAQSC